MQQTRAVSLVEASLNTLIGFLVTFLAWPIAGALFGLDYNTAQHFGVVLFFTVLSVARGYVIRRFFNNGLHLAALRIARGISSGEDG